MYCHKAHKHRFIECLVNKNSTVSFSRYAKEDLQLDSASRTWDFFPKAHCSLRHEITCGEVVSWLDVTGQLLPTHSHDHGNARERDENARACKSMKEREGSKQEKIK